MPIALLVAATLVALAAPPVAAAQPADDETRASAASVSSPQDGQDAPAPREVSPGNGTRANPGSTTAPAETAPSAEEHSALGRFMRDVGGDYKHFFSKETALWYGVGLGSAGLVHLADDDIAEEFSEPSATTRALEGGTTYGNLGLQVPLAIGWWITGHAVDSARSADAGRDLLRAQINATSWAYAWKYAVNRTRPNGDPRSFPSGHATAAFATAMVLEDHYGWKVGVPFFAAATYTSISRLTVNKHWASDVTFGAFVGIASARTVTLHLRRERFAVMPLVTPGGGGLALTKIG